MSKNKTNWELTKLLIKNTGRILQYGPPGTGKSYVAIHEPHSGGANGIHNVTITDEMPAAELRGHYVPKAGEFHWQDGPALRAWRNGDRLVVNEIDKASGDTLSFFLSLLDDSPSAMMTLPTGETVYPHKDFQCIATMNGAPSDLPPALQDRFPVTIEVTDPNPNAIASLPDDLRNAAQGSCVSPDPTLRISLRSWFAYAALRTRIGAPYAAEAVFGARAKEVLASLTIAAAA
jgi:MoxR-like ATPase